VLAGLTGSQPATAQSQHKSPFAAAADAEAEQQQQQTGATGGLAGAAVQQQADAAWVAEMGGTRGAQILAGLR